MPVCSFFGFMGNGGDAGHTAGKMLNISKRGEADIYKIWRGNGILFGTRLVSPITGISENGLVASNDDDTLKMVASGEIYNKKDLLDLIPPAPETNEPYEASGMEIMLSLYAQYGPGFVKYLRGAFAFCIYDANERQLLFGRDPFGIKSLYYTLENGLLFGNELKCFMGHPGFSPSLNVEALAQYLTFQYSVLPETFFKGVFRLPAGHYAIYKPDTGDFELTPYFTPTFSAADMQLSGAVQSIRGAVGESVGIHMPVSGKTGTFLSGGVDSAYIASSVNLLHKNMGQLLNTFTVGFGHKKYNELKYAGAHAKKENIINHAKIISEDEYWEMLPTIQYMMDEPLGDPSSIALFFACREAVKHVDTVFSGEGADEFFGGYNIYKEPLALARYMALPGWSRKLLAFIAKTIPFGFKGKNFIKRGDTPVEERYIGNARIFTPGERDELLNSPYNENASSPQTITKPIYERARGSDDITKMQLVDIELWLAGNILQKAEKMGMANSLDIRSPLLDTEVFKVAASLPTQLRVNKKSTKYAFRLAALGLVPQDSAKRKKLGFPVPIRIWLRDEKHHAFITKYFNNPTSKKYFNKDKLLLLLDEHIAKRKDNSRKIWVILMFLIWHEQYFDI